MKKIDTSKLRFSEIIDREYYFVNKSMLVADMLGKDSQASIST